MSSRESILQAVGRNKPAERPLPVIRFTGQAAEENVIDKFIVTLQAIGGAVKRETSYTPIRKEIFEKTTAGKYVVVVSEELVRMDYGINMQTKDTELEKVDLCYLEARLGVAENGAVWLDERNFPNRLLPFICQHLVIILKEKDIVANMHEAYAALSTFETGFGAFIAGPSKTADIEQSLVIGAHGARSLTLYLMA